MLKISRHLPVGEYINMEKEGNL